MFAKLSYTWELMGASWSVLKRDKALVLFPFLSAISCILVIASFLVPMSMIYLPLLKNSHEPGAPLSLTQDQKMALYVCLFAFYFANYFVITFFNVGIISCAVRRMAGGEPSFGGGLRAAFGRIHLIAGWALVSATVGLILRAIESHKKAGAIVAKVLGTAWAIGTFLVVPVLVVEDKGPIAALKESMTLLKKTWGMQLAGSFSFGFLFFLLLLPGFVAIFASLALMTGPASAAGSVLLGAGVLYIIALALIQSALHSIFQAALYMYTQGVSDSTGAFPAKLLGGAIYGNP